MDSMKRDEKRQMIADSILTSKQVLDRLGFSRVRLNQYVKEGRIKPIQLGDRMSVYLKEDIEAFASQRKTSDQ